MEKAVVTKDNRSLAAMATVLVALLLISQLSLASSNIRTTSDYNYDSLKVSEPDSNKDFLYSAPDFIKNSSNNLINLIAQYAVNHLSTTFFQQHTASYSIRSPPLFS